MSATSEAVDGIFALGEADFETAVVAILAACSPTLRASLLHQAGA